MTHEILVLYYSRVGATAKLAHLIARGIESVPGVAARIRTVPVVKNNSMHSDDIANEDGILYATKNDLVECIGLALGSPVRFGTMASNLQAFLETTGDEWLRGSLVSKPACVFTSSSSMHGGQEACLLSLMLPLLHHGMLIMGLPYTDSALMNTDSGGTPYGVSHVAGLESNLPITKDEHHLAFLQGKLLAQAALKLR